MTDSIHLTSNGCRNSTLTNYSYSFSLHETVNINLPQKKISHKIQISLCLCPNHTFGMEKSGLEGINIFPYFDKKHGL